MLFFSCVPAKKYEELRAKHQACTEENDNLKQQVQSLEDSNNELNVEIEKLTALKEQLMTDTTTLGEKIRDGQNKYNQLNQTCKILTEKNNKLKGNEAKLVALMKELQASQEELQNQEDALRTLGNDLSEKQASLSKLNEELAAREKRVQELEAMINRKDSALTALKEKVQKALLGFENNGLTIEQKNGKVYVSLDESLLFASGSYKVDPKGAEVLKKIAKVLEQQQDINVLVEGHTDNVPYKGSGDIHDNWDLSVKRATSVVKIITNNSKIKPSRLTAGGRGEYAPLDMSNTPEGRKKNRRTEIILAPNLDELFEILEAK